MTDSVVFPQKHALLIGINRYPKLAPRYQLHGCVNDVRSMKSVLTGSFGFPESNIKVLEDAAATREAILQELVALTGRIGESDVVVVHYSGHGSQRTDLERDETSGLDSTIVPHDSGRVPHPNLDITDDEIHDWLSQMARKTPFTTLIFDCCHSGTIARDPFGDTERWAEPDLRSKEEIRAELDQRGQGRGEEVVIRGSRGRSGWFPIDKSYTLIAGCADEESSFEMPVSDQDPLAKQGALTFHLVREMLQAGPGTTYRDVFEYASRNVSSRYARQHPQMEGVPDRKLFGVTEIRPIRFVPVQDRRESTVVLDAGAVHGLARGAQWAIYPQGTKSDAGTEDRLGMVEVVEVHGVSATARVTEENGQRPIQAGDRAVEKIPVISAQSLLVDVAPATAGCEQAAQGLAGRVAASRLLRLAAPGEATLAQARVYLIEPRTAVPVGAPLPELGQLSTHTWAVAGRDGRQLTPAHPLDSRVDGQPVVEVIVENLEKIASYRNRLSLTNPDRDNPLTGMVEFNLLHLNEHGTWENVPADPQSGHIVYTSEDKIALEVTNHSDKALYISLLDFGQNQSIELLYPPDRPSERLEANIPTKIWARTQDMEVYIDDDYPYDEDIETYKLIVTNQPVDLTWLEQEAARGSLEAEGQEKAQENATLFEQLYQQASLGTRGTRPVKPAPGETWITIERPFLIRKKSAAQPAAPASAVQAAATPPPATAAGEETPTPASPDTRNVINLSSGGTFKKTGLISSTAQDVDAIFDDLRAQQATHLVLYFHGGLVPETMGLRTANVLHPVFTNQAKAYPVFFIWETGLMEILSRNLGKIAQQPFFQQLMNAVMKFVLAKLEESVSGRSLAGLQPASDQAVQAVTERELTGEEVPIPVERDSIPPVDEEDETQFALYLESSPGFQQTLQRISESIQTADDPVAKDLTGSEELPEEVGLFSSNIIDGLARENAEIPEEGGGRELMSTAFLVKTAIGILGRVVKRFISGTDHGVVCTTTEEVLRQFYLDSVGAWVWGTIKDQAHAAFKDNIGLGGERLQGGTYFLEKLRDYLTDRNNAKLEVTLIGHSAGAIYICRLFEKALNILPADFIFKHIAFLAPAVDFDLFKQTLLDHADRFASFRMFAMLDEYECKDGIVPLVYPRSLLYFVSGVLEGPQEKPLVGMQRFYSGQPPYDTETLNAARAFIATQDAGRIVWSVAKGMKDGFNSAALSHGGFAEDAVTDTNLCFWIRS